MELIVFIDAEIDPSGKNILDIGAVTDEGNEFHSQSMTGFADFIRGHKYICVTTF